MELYENDGAGRDLMNKDVDFMCKIRRMRICHAIKISTSYYS